ETVFYPVFLCLILALVLALERPTITRQLVLLGVFVVAFLTRTQSVALLPAIATAPLMLAYVDRQRLGRALRPFRALYGLLALAVVAVVVVELARGHSVYDVLGSYSVTGHVHYRVANVLRWLLYHIAELDLYLAVVPFAALLLLAGSLRSLDRQLRIFVVSAVVVTAWLTLEVSTFAAGVPNRLEERNLFYVAPLFVIALLAWIERGLRPRPARATAVAALVAAALPATLPFDRFLDAPAESDALALIPVWWLKEGIVRLSAVPIAVGLTAVILAAAFVVVGPRFAYVLPALVLA